MGVPVSKLLGAAHGLEIGFVFDDIDAEMDVFRVASEENAPGRIELANAMSSYWVNFAKTGAPGRGVDGQLPDWAPYGTGQVMLLDTEAGGVRISAPVGVLRAVRASTKMLSPSVASAAAPSLPPAVRMTRSRTMSQTYASSRLASSGPSLVNRCSSRITTRVVQ